MGGDIRILVIGATGYIGGSILTELIDRGFADEQHISALVRQQYQASILTDAGINPVIFKSLDDLDIIRDTARDHDIVIACADARHPACAQACISGLGERQKTTGRAVSYIHTSGTSMLGDWPISGDRIDTKVYSDINDDIFNIEKDFPDSFSPVRRVNQLVVELGRAEGVKTFIVAPPLIFGPGTGSFTLGFGQIHMVVQMALKNQTTSVMVGAGSGVWNRVHINDLSNLFGLIVQAIIDQKPEIPHGKDGYYFVENGEQSWAYISGRIATTGKQLGVFESETVGEITLQDAADEFYEGELRDAEGVLASNSRVRADKARQLLGWEPRHGEDSFLEEIDDVVVNMVEQRE